MKITFLGTGTSCGVPFIACHCPTCSSQDPKDHRLRTSILLEEGDTRILMDCGPDFRQQMLRIGFEHKIDAVFITHEHYDHVGGIDDLRPLSNIQDVPLYADPYCANHLRERMPYCLLSHDYPGIPQLRLNDMQAHETVQVGPFSVTSFTVMHGKLPILGFRIGDVAYITDMTEMDESELSYLQGVKFLIINALRRTKPHRTHQTLEHALEFRNKHFGNIPTYIIHISHDMGLHADVEAELPENCHLAFDGLSIRL